jgi:hypothetical protein
MDKFAFIFTGREEHGFDDIWDEAGENNVSRNVEKVAMKVEKCTQ